MNQKKGSNFSSKLGFVLAAAGSAVGLGNIWRFPYLAAKYGGGIFLFVYVILAVTFGFAMLVTEISIGRRTGKSVIGAYQEIHPAFKPLGWLASFVPVIIFPYYCVIGGWVFKYMMVYLTGAGTAAADGGAYFADYTSHAVEPSVYFGLFMVLTAVIVLLGVEKGIERVSKWMMPVLVLITIVIAVFTVMQDGAAEGLIYYFKPDFSKFSIKTVVAAMGQLFYSLSISMGILVTYGSYMRKEDNIESCILQIEIFDSGIAILMGMIVVPSVFIFAGGGDQLNAGASLMFITLPQVFDSLPAGHIIGAVFFILVLLAALTSSIALMETVVHIVMERFHISRCAACIWVFLISTVLGMLSVFGFSIWSDVRIFGRDILDFFDFISNNIMMPIVAFLTCILIGYIVRTRYVEEEVECSGHHFAAKGLYRVMIRYVAPVCLVVIFLSSLFGWA